MKLNETLLEKISVNEGAGLTMMKFRFLYGGGIPTGNGNVYKASIIKSAVDNLNQRIEKAGPSYGMSGHKPDGELDAVSHLITKVETDKNGDAYATVKLLDTRAGKNLRAIIAGGGKLGVSARGHGSVKKDEKGHSVVGDDYRLDAVDFVMDPSVNGAWAGAENLFESAEILQPDAEEICALKYELAVRNSGYKGSYEDYKKNFAHHIDDKVETAESEKPKMSMEDIIETRYRAACRAGYLGTKHEYRLALFPETVAAPGAKVVKAAPKKLEEQELTEPAGFDSIMSRPDGLFLVDAIQEGADALFGLDEYTVMDISEGAAILASKDGGLFLQPWHRTQFGDQEIALHSQMKPMKESRYHVTAVHPETGETKDFDVDAVHAKSAAKKAQKKLSDAGLKHVVKTVNFAGETDAENSFWAGDGGGNPAASGADQTQSPGSGN